MNLLQLYHQIVPSGRRNVYVSSASGSDSNNGTSPSQAYATIQTAVNVAIPGDRIIVSGGGPAYGYTDVYGFNGNPAAYLSIEAANTVNRPQVNVINSQRGDGTYNDGIDIQVSSYVGVYGFDLYSDKTPDADFGPSGICVFRGSHHAYVWNNLIHNFPGGGANCFYVPATAQNPAGGWDCVDVSFNSIYNTSNWSKYNSSGISFYGAVDNTGETLDGRYGYRAVGNYIYNVICYAPNTPGGFTYVTDGNGLSYDSLNTANYLNPALGPYTKRGLCEGNVVVGCGGRGLHVFNTINVDDFFNTYIGNLRTDTPAITNGVETDAQYTGSPSGNNVTHYGNLICPLNTPNTTDGVSTYTDNIILGGTQAVPAGNTDYRTLGTAYFQGNPTAAELLIRLPMTSFTPVTTNAGTKQTGDLGYQTIGAGPRPVTTWACGGLEEVLKTKALVT